MDLEWLLLVFVIMIFIGIVCCITSCCTASIVSYVASGGFEDDYFAPPPKSALEKLLLAADRNKQDKILAKMKTRIAPKAKDDNKKVVVAELRKLSPGKDIFASWPSIVKNYVRLRASGQIPELVTEKELRSRIS